MFEVGKLYSCSVYFLSLFPDKETADEIGHRHQHLDAAYAAAYASAWNMKLGKPVSYCDPKTPLLVLGVEEKYIEVLAGDKVGWIINEDWLELKEIVNEAA